jgi:hypothetical protein
LKALDTPFSIAAPDDWQVTVLAWLRSRFVHTQVLLFKFSCVSTFPARCAFVHNAACSIIATTPSIPKGVLFMEEAVIGVFESKQQAEKARDSLRAAGFNPTNVRHHNLSDGPTSTRADEKGASGFFRSLFGSDEHPHVEHYSNAMERGHPVIMVRADREGQADRAQEIMEQCGALDIDD